MCRMDCYDSERTLFILATFFPCGANGEDGEEDFSKDGCGKPPGG